MISKAFAINLLIPGWCNSTAVKVNGKTAFINLKDSTYQSVKRTWKAGDKLEPVIDMPVQLIEANPLVEATRNQVAVKRGPVVYSLKSADLNRANAVFDVAIPANIQFKVRAKEIDNSHVMTLRGNARLLQHADWSNSLYHTIKNESKEVDFTLNPYYAWANRGRTDMTVWMPLLR